MDASTPRDTNTHGTSIDVCYGPFFWFVWVCFSFVFRVTFFSFFPGRLVGRARAFVFLSFCFCLTFFLHRRIRPPDAATGIAQCGGEAHTRARAKRVRAARESGVRGAGARQVGRR